MTPAGEEAHRGLPRWSVALDDQEISVEVTADNKISLRLPADRLVLSPEQAEDARMKIGSAIGVARWSSGGQ